MPRPRIHTSEEQALLGKNGASIEQRTVSTFDMTVHADVEKMPVPPRISSDPQKMALWNFVCSDMANRQILSPTYALTISELIEVVIMIKKCRDTLDEEGLTIDRYSADGRTMGQVPHPLTAVLKSQQGQLIKLIQMLGMSPRDIHYLASPEATPNQPIEATVKELKAIVYFRETK